MLKKGACAVVISSSDVREKRFDIVRKGYDPAAVEGFLMEIAQTIDAATPASGPATTAERESVMAEARDEIGRIRRMADSSAERTIRDATDEAQRTMIDARRDALALMERSRAEADAVVTEARLEEAALEERIIELRQVVGRTEHLLKAMASGALGDVAKADTTLAAVEVAAGQPMRVDLGSDHEVHLEAGTPTNDSEDASTLPDSVDRLLDQLREIG